MVLGTPMTAQARSESRWAMPASRPADGDERVEAGLEPNRLHQLRRAVDLDVAAARLQGDGVRRGGCHGWSCR